MVSAPVRVQRRLNVAVFTDLRKHILQHFRTFCKFRRTGLVEIVEFFEAEALFFDDLRIFAEIQLAALHFFLHGHGVIPPYIYDVPVGYHIFILL